MKRLLFRLLLVLLTVVVVSTAVFHVFLGSSLIDALYFTVTTVTTVGYGDFNLRQAPSLLKAYGILLMLLGPCAIGLVLGFVTDRIITERLETFFGKRRKKMRDHIIVCGLGQLGYRIVSHLVKLGEQVIVIEVDESSRFINRVKRLGVEVITDNSSSSEVLESAFVDAAKAMVVATDDDLVNLQTTATARALRHDLHIVLRMFDQDFADRIEESFQIDTAFSSTAISAPAFALAAVDRQKSIVNSFYTNEQLMITVHFKVDSGSQLAGRTIGQLRNQHKLSVVTLRSSKDGVMDCPDDHLEVRVGDELTLVAARDNYRNFLAVAAG